MSGIVANTVKPESSCVLFPTLIKKLLVPLFISGWPLGPFDSAIETVPIVFFCLISEGETPRTGANGTTPRVSFTASGGRLGFGNSPAICQTNVAGGRLLQLPN